MIQYLPIKFIDVEYVSKQLSSYSAVKEEKDIPHVKDS